MMKVKNKILILIISILVFIAFSFTLVYAPKPTPNPTPQLLMIERGSIQVPSIGPEQEYSFEISTEAYRQITIFFSSIEAMVVGPESGFGVIIDNKLESGTHSFTGEIDKIHWGASNTGTAFCRIYEVESPEISLTFYNLSPTKSVSDLNMAII